MESKVIVIHHGSHSLRIGLASDSVPKIVPNIIARRIKVQTTPTTKKDDTPMKIDDDKATSATTDTNIDTTTDKMDVDKPIATKTETTNTTTAATTSTDSNTTTTTTNNITKIQLSKKSIEELEQSIKETTKLLPPVDYIKVRQKPTLFNENNSMTSEIVKKKKKKPSTATNAPYQPPQLKYDDIDYCIGDDAITVSRDKNKWISYQPIIMSTFNSGIYNSIQSMYDDITQMWKYAISRYLNIPSSDLSSYGCVYVVQDSIDKKTLKEITTLILNNLQFTSVLFFQESICSTFGVSMSTQSCVVDIGHEKISIACVDEGYLLPNTRVTLSYGGEQLTKLLEFILTNSSYYNTSIGKQIHKYYFPFKSSDNEIVDFSPFYFNVFDQIKTENLDYNYNDIQKQRVGTFKVRDIKQEKYLNTYHFNADEVYQIVGMSLFYPSVLTQFGGSSVNYVVNSKPALIANGNGDNMNVEKQQHYFNHYLSSYDYEDPFESSGITVGNSIGVGASGSGGSNSSSPIKLKNGKSNTGGKEVDIPLDVAINKSVSQLERSDINKRKYLSNILLVGGGALAPGLQDVLKVRIFKQMELQHQQQQQTAAQQATQSQSLQNSTNSTPTPTATTILENYIGFFTGSNSIRTDVDPRHSSWRGGAILGCLESTKEIWITKQEWKDGRKASVLFQNKLPF